MNVFSPVSIFLGGQSSIFCIWLERHLLCFTDVNLAVFTACRADTDTSWAFMTELTVCFFPFLLLDEKLNIWCCSQHHCVQTTTTTDCELPKKIKTQQLVTWPSSGRSGFCQQSTFLTCHDMASRKCSTNAQSENLSDENYNWWLKPVHVRGTDSDVSVIDVASTYDWDTNTELMSFRKYTWNRILGISAKADVPARYVGSADQSASGCRSNSDQRGNGNHWICMSAQKKRLWYLNFPAHYYAAHTFSWLWCGCALIRFTWIWVLCLFSE